jgi:hypothetical protein
MQTLHRGAEMAESHSVSRKYLVKGSSIGRRKARFHFEWVLTRFVLLYLRWTLFGATGLSLIFSYVGLCGCQFLIVKSKTSPEDQGQGLGFFNLAHYNSDQKKYGCLPYQEDEKDLFASGGAFAAGRAFGVMAVMAETFAFFIIFLVMLFLKPYSNILWRVLQGLNIFAFFTQLFIFSAFAADVCDYFQGIQTTCAAGASSGLASINVILIVLLIFMSFSVPPPPNPVFKRWEDGDGREITGLNLPVREITEAEDGPEDKERAKESPIVPMNIEENEDDVDVEDNRGEKSDGDYSSSSDERDDDDDGGYNSSGVESYEEDLGEGETCSIMKEVGPEGTKVTKEVTHVDGSKTITTTIEASSDDEAEEVHA